MTGPQVPEGLAERARRLLNGITPGPWSATWEGSSTPGMEDCGVDVVVAAGSPVAYLGDDEQSKTDTDFIAEAPTLVAGLLDELTRWGRVAPFLDDDTIRLAEAAADVAEVLPDGWSAIVMDESQCVEVHERPDGLPPSESFRFYLAEEGDGWGVFFADEDRTDCDRPAPVDAARAALAALSGDPTDG